MASFISPLPKSTAAKKQPSPQRQSPQRQSSRLMTKSQSDEEAVVKQRLLKDGSTRRIEQNTEFFQSSSESSSAK